MSSNFRQTPNAENIPVDVVGSSTFARHKKISSALMVNMFISDEWATNFAGYQRYIELSTGGKGRGIYRSVRGNVIVAVINSEVWLLQANGAQPVNVGNLSTHSGDVFMDENLNAQICIVDGQNAYILTYGGPPSLTQQVIAGSLIPNYVKYHNTFFLLGNADTTSNGAAWYAYQFNSPTTIAQNSQFALQTKPDHAIAIERIPGQGNNVLVFGNTVCEIFTQVGGLENYRRNKTINLDYGCLSVSTIASSDQYIAWLGVNESNAPTILVYKGQGASAISSDGIDYVLGNLEHPEQSTAMFYRVDGHLCYQLTFYHPADNLTLIYDFVTQKFFNLTDAFSNYHPANEVIYFNESLLFISLNNGSIYQMSTDLKTYNENLIGTQIVDPTLIHTIPRQRITESLRRPDSSRFIANSLVLTIEQGNDPSISQLLIDSVPPGTIYRPRVDLSISKDGGITWGNIVSRPLNPIGKRKNILTWNNLGASNDLTFKFEFWMHSSLVVNNAVVEIY